MKKVIFFILTLIVFIAPSSSASAASEFEPVIVVPGLLGSWEKNNEWVIDPVGKTYDDLINTFRANGYVDNVNLFPFPYDWRNSNVITASLLKDKIQQVKTICNCDHVNVIAHSMGGLVAWQYIESPGYQNDIDQLFLLAVPMDGAAQDYPTWESGGIGSFGSPVITNIMQKHFLLDARRNLFLNTFDYIRNRPITSIQELLPTYDYLVDNTSDLRTYPTGYPRNLFLENLHSRFTQGWKDVRVNNIVAVLPFGQDNTPYAFFVEPSNELPKWQDGKPVSTFTDMGDGTVPYLSATAFANADKTFVDTSHIGIVATSSAYIFEKLNNKKPSVIISTSMPDAYLLIELLSPIDMQIIAPDGKRLGRNFTTNTELDEIPDAFYSGFIGDNEYAVIPDPLPGTYTIKTIGTGSGGEYTIATDYIDGQGDVSTELSGSAATNQVLTNNLVVSTTSRTITLVANNPDNTPPAITITNPTKYRLYARTESVLLTATINDASSVATSTYWFNGKKINPGLPLAFGSSTPLIDKVAVSATDSAGNTATSSLTFFVVKTKTSCLTDIVQIVATVLTDKTLPDKTTLQQLINDCGLLTKR